MSEIYTSSATAETINRAIDNSMGLTTTEQGASAAGLIIKEDLRPIIQNVQDYTNPAVTKSISGAPPLSFHAIQAVIAWSIYGNTDTGVSVGTASDNLFDKTNADIYPSTNISTTLNRWSAYDGTGKTVRIPCSANTTYAISIDSAIEQNIFRVLIINTDSVPYPDNPVIGTTVISSSDDNTAVFSTLSDTKYIVLQFTATIFDSAIDSLMLVTGSTPKPYEPYGVRVPILFNSVAYDAYISDYLRKSSGDDPVYDIMSSDGTLLRAVNADGTAKEEPTTEAYTAPALTSLWGWNTFDVDTTVDPSNVIIRYKDT